MVTDFPSWLFNLILWSALIAIAGLSYEQFVGPVLSHLTALVGLALAAVLALFWPRI